jgi:hypothetical protein
MVNQPSAEQHWPWLSRILLVLSTRHAEDKPCMDRRHHQIWITDQTFGSHFYPPATVNLQARMSAGAIAPVLRDALRYDVFWPLELSSKCYLAAFIAKLAFLMWPNIILEFNRYMWNINAIRAAVSEEFRIITETGLH